MSDREKKLWMMVRRGLLLICAAIKREHDPPSLLLDVRQGLIIIADAIEAECKGTAELV